MDRPGDCCATTREPSLTAATDERPPESGLGSESSKIPETFHVKHLGPRSRAWLRLDPWPGPGHVADRDGACPFHVKHRPYCGVTVHRVRRSDPSTSPRSRKIIAGRVEEEGNAVACPRRPLDCSQMASGRAGMLVSLAQIALLEAGCGEVGQSVVCRVLPHETDAISSQHLLPLERRRAPLRSARVSSVAHASSQRAGGFMPREPLRSSQVGDVTRVPPTRRNPGRPERGGSRLRQRCRRPSWQLCIAHPGVGGSAAVNQADGAARAAPPTSEHVRRGRAIPRARVHGTAAQLADRSRDVHEDDGGCTRRGSDGEALAVQSQIERTARSSTTPPS